MITFPGGTFKASTNAGLAATTISGGLTTLVPGGLRVQHWHTTNEWAYVLNGTCRAAALTSNQGAIKSPTSVANVTVGDIWYFPANTVHYIVGLEPSGCSFIAGYDAPDFDGEGVGGGRGRVSS